MIISASSALHEKYKFLYHVTFFHRLTFLNANVIGFGSMFLYKRWYRGHIALGSFAADNDVIERRENLSLEEFRTKYDGKKPVRFTLSYILFILFR